MLRWLEGYHLVDASGLRRPGWQIARGRKSWDHRLLWDVRRWADVRVGVLAFGVSGKIIRLSQEVGDGR
jgi:hypothetical protein